MRYNYVVIHVALADSDTQTITDLFGVKTSRKVGYFITTVRTLTLDAGENNWSSKRALCDHCVVKRNTTDAYAVLCHFPEAVMNDLDLYRQARSYAENTGWADLRAGLRMMGRYVPSMIEGL